MYHFCFMLAIIETKGTGQRREQEYHFSIFFSFRPTLGVLLNKTKCWSSLGPRFFILSHFYFSLFLLPQWDFSHGKFGLLFLEKASCDRVMITNLRCMLGVLMFL